MAQAPAAAEAKEDDFDGAFEQAAVDAQAQVNTQAADGTPAAGDGADEKPAAGDGADDKTATPAAGDSGTPPADETAEQKTPREAAEAKAIADAKVVDDAKIVADAAAAVRAATEAKAEADRKAAEAAAKVETAEQKAAREAHEASIAPYEPTEDEKKALEKFKIDFPGEYAAMEAKLKGVDRDINARVSRAVQQVLQQINGVVTPIAQQTALTAQEAHVRTIYAAHSDFETVIKGVPEWIKKQPAYLQPAMQQVYDKGDAQSVIALVTDYKKSAGLTATKTAAEIQAEADAKLVAVAAAAKAAAEAAALLPVGSKRTTTGGKGKADPNDYNGAWDEVAAETTKK